MAATVEGHHLISVAIGRRKPVLDRLRQSLSNRAKAVLDRRYVRHKQLNEIADAVNMLREQLDQLQSQVQALASRTGQGDLFVGSEDPNEMRRALFNAVRLADECSRAIEQLLQSDILLRRDLDAVS
jgi:hypothetical protein